MEDENKNEKVEETTTEVVSDASEEVAPENSGTVEVPSESVTADEEEVAEEVAPEAETESAAE